MPSQHNPVKFLLNTEDEDNQVVSAPAFSLTKVLASAAAVVAPLATVVVNEITDLSLTEWNWVALAIGVLGFLAITASADVIGRSIATSAESRQKAAEAARAGVVQFVKPVAAHHAMPAARNHPIEVLAAAQGDEPFFLVREDEKLAWLKESEVKIP